MQRLAKLLELEANGEPLTFTDMNTASEYAREAISAASAFEAPENARLMNGIGEDKFDPLGSYTAEQAIVTMYRLYLLDCDPETFFYERETYKEFSNFVVYLDRYEFFPPHGTLVSKNRVVNKTTGEVLLDVFSSRTETGEVYSQHFFEYDEDTLLWGNVRSSTFDFTYNLLHLDGTTEPFASDYLINSWLVDGFVTLRRPAGEKNFNGIYRDWLYGLMDTDYKTVLLPVEYGPGYRDTPKGDSSFVGFVDGCMILSKDGKFGALNEKLEVILPFEYDKLLWLKTYEAPYLLSYEKDGVNGKMEWKDGGFTEITGAN